MLRILLCCLVSSVAVADATKLVKEPKYTGQPGYATFKFGQKTPQVVWLVLDGETLYIDANGNGDLTEAGEKFTAKKGGTASAPLYSFSIDKLTVGTKTHRGLQVQAMPLISFSGHPLIAGQKDAEAQIKARPEAMSLRLVIEVEAETLKGSGHEQRVLQYVQNVDDSGINALAESPDKAPQFHFDGPMRFYFQFGAIGDWMGGEMTDAYAALGTAGTLPGTCVFYGFDVLPTSIQPKLKIEYSAKPTATDEVKLPDRC
jgi:hypothetical protein